MLYKNYRFAEVPIGQILIVHFLYSYYSTCIIHASDSGKQKEITDAIVSFVAIDLQPFSIVESAFRNVLEKAEPRYTTSLARSRTLGHIN